MGKISANSFRKSKYVDFFPVKGCSKTHIFDDPTTRGRFNLKAIMENYFSRYTRAELLEILSNERRKFNSGVGYGSPAGHLEEVKQVIQLIEAALTEKESLNSGREFAPSPPIH